MSERLKPDDTNVETPGDSSETPHCEFCTSNQQFSFIGVQTWPPAVAEKLACDPTVYLWRCDECHTTITTSKTS